MSTCLPYESTICFKSYKARLLIEMLIDMSDYFMDIIIPGMQTGPSSRKAVCNLEGGGGCDSYSKPSKVPPCCEPYC